MSKDPIKKLAKKFKGLRNDMRDLWVTVEGIREDLDNLRSDHDEVKAEVYDEVADANPSMAGSPENPELAVNPMGGEPVVVRDVAPNRDGEASQYTFHFTEEELARLGIPDMSYHLEQIPGASGRLRIVSGPPTNLLPGHEELIRNRDKEN